MVTLSIDNLQVILNSLPAQYPLVVLTSSKLSLVLCGCYSNKALSRLLEFSGMKPGPPNCVLLCQKSTQNSPMSISWFKNPYFSGVLPRGWGASSMKGVGAPGTVIEKSGPEYQQKFTRLCNLLSTGNRKWRHIRCSCRKCRCGCPHKIWWF